MDSLKKTSLFEKHQEYGGKMVDFLGWSLPIHFKGIISIRCINYIPNNGSLAVFDH